VSSSCDKILGSSNYLIHHSFLLSVSCKTTGSSSDGRSDRRYETHPPNISFGEFFSSLQCDLAFSKNLDLFPQTLVSLPTTSNLCSAFLFLALATSHPSPLTYTTSENAFYTFFRRELIAFASSLSFLPIIFIFCRQIFFPDHPFF